MIIKGIATAEDARIALDHGVSSAAVILNILARRRDPAPGTILSIPQALKLALEPIADCARYDSLRSTNSHGTGANLGNPPAGGPASKDCGAGGRQPDVRQCWCCGTSWRRFGRE